MILKKITLLNYKNIEDITLDLSPKMNCFIGHNGVGKTNMLDAVYYLSFCRSSSNAVDSQVMMHDKDFFVLEGLYTNEANDEELIYCGMKRGSKKHFKRAVKRNRVKRQVREAYRKHKRLVTQSVDKLTDKQLLIAFIWLSDELTDSDTIEQRVCNLLQRIGERILKDKETDIKR